MIPPEATADQIKKQYRRVKMLCTYFAEIMRA